MIIFKAISKIIFMLCLSLIGVASIAYATNFTPGWIAIILYCLGFVLIGLGVHIGFK